MIAWSMVVLSGALAAAAVPEVVAVSAFLEEGGVPVDQVVSARFTFFDAPEGGEAVWSETQAELAVVGGVLSAELGNQGGNPLVPETFSGSRWLEIMVNDVVLEPRARAASVPYALAAARAEACQSLDGITSDDIDTIARDASAPITRSRIAGAEVPLYIPAPGCDPTGASGITLSPTCSSLPCALGNGFAHLRCDGTCGAPSRLECSSSVVGWLLPP